ncbi:uncharacterized protein LOC120003957 isoform X2 [Tripterygium wilfordii]|uniref:uncharacterized protein LOC120003957 isoform X2 n=1 Tax=Tripterygium wilfordii TaxID=458696 RepID=UPI0018F7F64B|nr:uncharacterized protein LOC120003957 isoform X2 [Tripterygium wilfordii]
MGAYFKRKRTHISFKVKKKKTFFTLTLFPSLSTPSPPSWLISTYIDLRQGLGWFNRASRVIDRHLLTRSLLHIAIENKEYAKFCKHGFKFKEELEFCFAGTYATGAYRMTSSSGVIPPQNTTMGQENQNYMDADGLHTWFDDDAYVPEPPLKDLNLDNSPVRVVDAMHDEVFSTATSPPKVQQVTPSHTSGTLGKRSSQMSSSRIPKKRATNKADDIMVELVQAVQSVAGKLNAPSHGSSMGDGGWQSQNEIAFGILKKMRHDMHMSTELFLFAVDLLRDSFNNVFFITCDDELRLPFIERKYAQYQQGTNMGGLESINVDGDDDRQAEREWVGRFVVIVSATVAAMYYYRRRGSYIDRVSCRTSALQGSNWIAEILRGHPARCSQLFRMKKEIFRELCIVLRDNYMLPTTNDIGIPEMVAMFLFTLGQGAGNRLLQECFQHTGETISRLFRQVLHSVYLMSMDLIKPRENQFDTVPARIRNDPKYSPFRNCIGAIDGTHIPAIIPKDERGRFIGRKGFTTQNVMAACDFDMLYIFVLAGWEGSAHDARVFQDAITDESLHFPHPPPVLSSRCGIS